MPETIEHLLFECEWTKSIWFGCSLGLRLEGVLGNLSDRINSLLCYIKTGTTRINFLSTFAYVAWSIWKARNRFIFEQSALDPAQVIVEAQINVGDFERAHCFVRATDVSNMCGVSQESSPKWIPPTSNIVKLNCDASFNAPNAASGIVARNSIGSLLACFGKKWRCESALAAELQAIRSSCIFAANKGWFNAIIESDSQSAIALATLENVPPWALSALSMDIRYWISHMKFQLLWTSRRCNRVAHHVAKVALNSPDSFMWESNFPVEITSIACIDVV